MIKKIIKPIYIRIKQSKEKNLFLRSLAKADDLKLVVGSSNIFQEGWIPSESHFLNLLNPDEWSNYFKEGSISNIAAEHVWEHLDEKDGQIAINTCYKYLKKGGKLRIAVPDGFHPDPNYIEAVKIGGTGAGADDHKMLYNYKTLSEALKKAGFTVNLIEYFDENGNFIQNELNPEDGFVRRSLNNDSRNKDGKPNYTSLIVDGIK